MCMGVVAIAYVMHKAPNVFPIIGGRKVEQLKSNLEALDISLSKEQLEYLDGAVPFDPGFPMTMIVNFAFFPFLTFGLVVCRAMEQVTLSSFRWLQRWRNYQPCSLSNPKTSSVVVPCTLLA